MRLDTPRVPPLAVEEMDEDLRVRFGDGPVLNIFRTLAHYPKLMSRWLVFGNHVLGKSSLPAREREIAILRVGWNCRAEYEWAQHHAIGLASGLSEAEIERIADGPDAPGWSAAEAALLRATDELCADRFVSDHTWKTLTEHFNQDQLFDLIFAVGQYNLVSMALNTLGVQLEEGAARFPKR